MHDAVSALTLPRLQQRLDALAPGETLALGVAEVRRLFGVNDVGQARAENFALGHRCRVAATPSAITFHKL